MRGIPAKDACSVYDASSFGVVRSEVQPFHLKKGITAAQKQHVHTAGSSDLMADVFAAFLQGEDESDDYRIGVRIS